MKSLIGICYYADDPHKRVFRTVYPEFDDSELDGPPTDGNRKPMLDDKGQHHTWTSFGVDPARAVVFEKVPADKPHGHKRGTPGTPASEPIVYLVNTDQIPDQFADNIAAFIAVDGFSNNIMLPNMTALPATLLSPSWVVVINDDPGNLGKPTLTKKFGGATVNVWKI